ncbi:Bacterial SH3 domain protein [Roseovarius sp. THAF8]|uniref:SH3 domain-containing protein n=1 Tax=Roseovarius sp. THAF8 TaxID=2587846 RepID=UPI001267858E|nr:SH3 domain-containing protein [Roseovarius sp. THAF8]QFT97928.1 Bacterial SH3 domain protein [Roseovarius sp. THAF8]
MKAVLSACLLSLWASLAHAQAVPAFYDVSGVAPDDVLNVRAAPGVGNSIVAKLDSGATYIEVVGFDDSREWARINVEEQSGWVAARFLTRRAGQPDDELPRPLVCTGTEPFWSLEVARTASATLDRMDEDPVSVSTLNPVTSENRTDRYAIFGQSQTQEVFTFMFQRDACTDGMSDRYYGMSVDLFVTEESGVTYLTGCCNLSR